MDPFWQFIAGYLNQDLDLIFGDPEEAVREFGRHAPSDVAVARAGVADLLRRHPDDAGLLAEAERLGCDYLPAGEGEFRAILEFALATWPDVASARSAQSA